jgi:phosphoglycerol transferase MdoB-like AlkP superfamily enzyme
MLTNIRIALIHNFVAIDEKLWMKETVISLIKQFLFWILFFALLRLVFLLYHWGLLIQENIGFPETLSSFWHALPLDIASACYIMVIPVFLLFITGFAKKACVDWANKIFVLIIIVLYSLITVAELGVYREWKSKISAKTLAYLRHPAEAYHSISAGQFFTLLAIFIGLVLVTYIAYTKFFYKSTRKPVPGILKSLAFLIIVIPLLVIGMRGGLGPIPISQSASYYSHHNILNVAAVNSGHNMAVSLMQNMKFGNTNPYEFYDQAEAEKTVKSLFQVEKDTTIRILKVARPNIVILLMESWSADLIQSLGGREGITPEFAKLENGGILFTRFYASGNRSQQAIATIFGGFPALPFTTITENPEKYTKLPSLIKDLSKVGYSSAFYFGGQLIYGNIKAYILFNQFDKIMEEKDIDASVPRGRLGVHDEFLYGIMARDMNNLKEPFIAMAFSLSSHSPYDEPMKPVIDWAGNENPFINSAFYSDYSLGKYFNQVKDQPWFKNTLFIIIADHSHNTYRNWPLESFEYHKIPFLLYGDAIRDEFRGTQINRISSTDDFSSTLLNQLGMDHKDYGWSNNLFNPYSPEFAYFEINDGVGWKRPGGEFVYNVRDKYYYLKKMDVSIDSTQQEKIIHEGKSFIQVLFQTFMNM